MGVPVGQEGFPVKYRRKLPGKYDKTRKRSERGKIVFVIISVFFTVIVSVSSVTVIVSVFFETAVKPRKRAPVNEIFGYGFHP